MKDTNWRTAPKKGNTETHRTCTNCKEIKELNSNNFHKSRNKDRGFTYTCKICRNLKEEGKIRTESDKKSRRESSRKQREKPDFVYLSRYLSYRQKDKDKNYFFDLDKEYIKESLQKPCIYCTYPSYGLDRINNNLGHTKENCVPCCFECNISRNDIYSHEEMLIVGKAIKQIKDLRVQNGISHTKKFLTNKNI